LKPALRACPDPCGGRRRRRGHTALLVAALALSAAAGARAGDCLRFEPEDVTLSGTLRLEVFPGPPHYKSFDAGDRPEGIWMITLARPVCIDATPGDDSNAAAADVAVVQIVPRATFSVAYNGKAARARGTLYRPHGGHPHAQVLLRATSVTLEGR